MQNNTGSKIKYFSKEEALEAILQNGGFKLQFCSSDLQNNEEVVMEAIKQESAVFQFASKRLKSSKAFIMKAIHEDVEISCLISQASVNIKSDIEVMTLAVEMHFSGAVFADAEGDAALNKELAAKALVKFGSIYRTHDMWKRLHPTLQKFFPKDSWYEKAQVYLCQLEHEKQAKMVSGGSSAEDAVVW